jgi:hypothetical protein
MAPAAPPGIVSRATDGRAKKFGGWGQTLDHENRKTPISKPAANAQRPKVQAEIRRTRLRRSCGISWDRSVIAAAPCGGRQGRYGRIRNPLLKTSPASSALFSWAALCAISGRFCSGEWPVSASTRHPLMSGSILAQKRQLGGLSLPSSRVLS